MKVTYNLRALALSQFLPSPTVAPSLEPKVVIEIGWSDDTSQHIDLDRDETNAVIEALIDLRDRTFLNA